MKYSLEQKTKLKSTPITSYLHSVGINPVSTSGGRLTYYCPLKDEHTPSFMVHPESNKFKCFGCDQKGDVFELVSQLERLDFVATLDRLATLTPTDNLSFSFIGHNSSQSNDQSYTAKGLTLIAEKPLQSHEWLTYTSSRGIPEKLASAYLNEVSYRNGRYIYDAVGFKTDAGGYAVRSPKGKGFKAFIGQSNLTSVRVADFDTVNLFEGFFDFLSALVYFSCERPSRTTLVLNSTANIKQALPTLLRAKTVYCYLDNDTAGYKALQHLKASGVTISDRSNLYAKFKDFNQMISA
jgi:DNA primase